MTEPSERAMKAAQQWFDSTTIPPGPYGGYVRSLAAAIDDAYRDGWAIANRYAAECEKHIPVTEARDPMQPEIMVRQVAAAARAVPKDHIREGVTDRKVLDTWHQGPNELRLVGLDEPCRIFRVRAAAEEARAK